MSDDDSEKSGGDDTVYASSGVLEQLLAVGRRLKLVRPGGGTFTGFPPPRHPTSSSPTPAPPASTASSSAGLASTPEERRFFETAPFCPETEAVIDMKPIQDALRDSRVELGAGQSPDTSSTEVAPLAPTMLSEGEFPIPITHVAPAQTEDVSSEGFSSPDLEGLVSGASSAATSPLSFEVTNKLEDLPDAEDVEKDVKDGEEARSAEPDRIYEVTEIVRTPRELSPWYKRIIVGGFAALTLWLGGSAICDLVTRNNPTPEPAPSETSSYSVPTEHRGKNSAVVITTLRRNPGISLKAPASSAPEPPAAPQPPAQVQPAPPTPDSASPPEPSSAAEPEPVSGSEGSTANPTPADIASYKTAAQQSIRDLLVALVGVDNYESRIDAYNVNSPTNQQLMTLLHVIGSKLFSVEPPYRNGRANSRQVRAASDAFSLVGLTSADTRDRAASLDDLLDSDIDPDLIWRFSERSGRRGGMNALDLLSSLSNQYAANPDLFADSAGNHADPDLVSSLFTAVIRDLTTYFNAKYNSAHRVAVAGEEVVARGAVVARHIIQVESSAPPPREFGVGEEQVPGTAVDSSALLSQSYLTAMQEQVKNAGFAYAHLSRALAGCDNALEARLAAITKYYGHGLDRSRRGRLILTKLGLSQTGCVESVVSQPDGVARVASFIQGKAAEVHNYFKNRQETPLSEHERDLLSATAKTVVALEVLSKLSSVAAGYRNESTAGVLALARDKGLPVPSEQDISELFLREKRNIPRGYQRNVPVDLSAAIVSLWENGVGGMYNPNPFAVAATAHREGIFEGNVDRLIEEGRQMYSKMMELWGRADAHVRVVPVIIYSEGKAPDETVTDNLSTSRDPAAIKIRAVKTGLEAGFSELGVSSEESADTDSADPSSPVDEIPALEKAAPPEAPQQPNHQPEHKLDEPELDLPTGPDPLDGLPPDDFPDDVGGLTADAEPVWHDIDLHDIDLSGAYASDPEPYGDDIVSIVVDDSAYQRNSSPGKSLPINSTSVAMRNILVVDDANSQYKRGNGTVTALPIVSINSSPSLDKRVNDQDNAASASRYVADASAVVVREIIPITSSNGPAGYERAGVVITPIVSINNTPPLRSDSQVNQDNASSASRYVADASDVVVREIIPVTDNCSAGYERAGVRIIHPISLGSSKQYVAARARDVVALPCEEKAEPPQELEQRLAA